MDKINPQKQQHQEDEEPVIIEERITKVNGDFFIKRHQRGKFLGKGGFAKVYVFTNLETGKISAGKIMPKANLNRSRSKQKLMVEIRLHKQLHHPNIVRFEHVFEDQDNVYIMLELCHNQSMSELVKRRKRLTEFEVQCYVIQIVDGLKYLQANRVIHRDLKLGNLFLSDKMQIKMGDFGLATKLEFDGEKKRTVCGTPNYLAPEVLDGAVGHSYQVDVWSLGVIIYTMLFGRPPFETKDIKLTYKRIKECNYSFPEAVPVSDNVKDLIAKILIVQPEKRLTLDEILLHPFINQGQAIPKLLPVSTMTMPPTANYIKQFMLSSSSQRVRINTESETLDANDILKSVRGVTASVKVGTKIGLDHPTLDLMKGNQTNFDFIHTRFNTITGGLSNRGKQFSFPEPKSPEMRKAPPALETIEVDGVLNIKTGLEEAKSPSLRKGDSSRGLKPTNKERKESKDMREKKESKDTKEPKEPKEAKEDNNKEAAAVEIALPLDGDIHVVRWYDYSVKYGLGYVLSNGSVGISLNDGSKMIALNNKTFTCITRRASDKQEEVKEYSFKDYPQEVHKMVLVHQKFKEQFEVTVKQIKMSSGAKCLDQVYIKKWIKTKQGLFFRLNNRSLQVAFKDGTIVLMNSNTKVLTFVDKENTVHTCSIEGAAKSTNNDLARRAKYIEEVLTKLWNVKTDTMMTIQTQKTEMAGEPDTLNLVTVRNVDAAKKLETIMSERGLAA